MRTYKLPIGDTFRVLELTLSRDNNQVWEEPVSAVLKIKLSESVYETRTLTREDDDDPGVWRYQLESSDFGVFSDAATYDARVYATYAGGRKARFPSEAPLKIEILEDWA